MRLTIIAGIGEDRHGDPITAVGAKLTRIRQLLATAFGGFTETAHTGGWVDGSGLLVLEPGVSWTIFTDESQAAAEEAADYVRAVLNQESVGVAIEPAAVRWVTAPAELEEAA